MDVFSSELPVDNLYVFNNGNVYYEKHSMMMTITIATQGTHSLQQFGRVFPSPSHKEKFFLRERTKTERAMACWENINKPNPSEQSAQFSRLTVVLMLITKPAFLWCPIQEALTNGTSKQPAPFHLLFSPHFWSCLTPHWMFLGFDLNTSISIHIFTGLLSAKTSVPTLCCMLGFRAFR